MADLLRAGHFQKADNGLCPAVSGGLNGNSPYSPESTAGTMRQYRAIPFNNPDVEANAKANGRIMFDVERCARGGSS